MFIFNKKILGRYLAFFLMVFSASHVMAKTVTLEHIKGSTTVTTSPQRVVVIGIGGLDTLDALGIQPVAVSKGTTLPDNLKKYADDAFASSGSIFEPDFEAIFNQNPDLIIVGSRSSKHFDELSKIAPTYVYAIENGLNYWENTQKLWRDLGLIFEKTEQVENKITQLDQRINAIYEYNQTHQMNALTIMVSGGNISAFTPNSRFAIFYKDFGFTPSIDIKKEKKGEKTGGHGNLVSYELISQNNPATILVLDKDTLTKGSESTTRKDFDNDLIKSTQAYKNNRFAYLDIASWYVASSGMTATETMIKEIEPLIQQ